MPKKNSSQSSKRSKTKTSTQGNTESTVLESHTDDGPQGPAAKEKDTAEEMLQELTEYESDDGMPTIKRRHLPETLSSEQEQALVDWFAEQPLYFDQTHIHFKNRGKKERLLGEKAT